MVSSQSSPQTTSQPTFAPLRPLKVTALDKHTSQESASEEFYSPTSIHKSPTSNIQPSIATRTTLIDTQKADDPTKEVCNEFPKPPYSYSCLIALALKNSKEGTLQVQEIYKFIQSFFPFYRTAPRHWQNAVRHCLCSNKCFEKVVTPVPGFSDRKCNSWQISVTHSLRLENDLLNYYEKFFDRIVNSMEYPHLLGALYKEELRIEYSSSSDDEAQNNNSLVATTDIVNPRSTWNSVAISASHTQYVGTKEVLISNASMFMPNGHDDNAYEDTIKSLLPSSDPEIIVLE